MTAHLWMRLIEDIKVQYGFKNVTLEMIQKISATPKSKLSRVMKKMREQII